MKLKELLGLYSVNINQLRQTWNFNRFVLLLGHRFRIADLELTEEISSLRSSADWEMSSRMYRPLISLRRKKSHASSPDVLVVAQHGRFGNMVRQVALAIASAERLGVREVIVKSFPGFPLGTWVLDNGVALTHDSFIRSRMIARPRLALGGDFFVKPRLPVDVEGVDFDLIASSLMEAGRLTPSEPLPPGVLVIHFRSGDAFSQNPHPGLGQPPLAFYHRVIEHENPAKVVLVFEDRRNPTIDSVIHYLETLKLPYSVQSGSFADDLEVLLAARSLVTANGTLTEALLMLSPYVERWASYSRDPQLFFRSRSVPTIIGVADSSGEYSSRVLTGNWKNTADQRALMLSHPAEDLLLREIS